MKKMIVALFAALVIGGAVSAQNAIFEVPNASVMVGFYQGDPEAGGALLESKRINNSPFSRPLGATGHDFVTLAYEGETFTFATFPGGANKYDIYLNLEGVEKSDSAYTAAQESAMSLGDLVDQLANDPNTLQNLSN